MKIKEPVSAFSVYKSGGLSKMKSDNSKVVKKKLKVEKNKSKKKELLKASSLLNSGHVEAVPVKRGEQKKKEVVKGNKKDAKPVTNGKTAMNETVQKKKVKKVKSKETDQNPSKKICKIEQNDDHDEDEVIQMKTNGNKDEKKVNLSDPIIKGKKLFEWMISPIPELAFFEKHWEKEPLYVIRESNKYYTHILSSRDLDRIFRENNLHYTRNVDVVIYENEEKQILNPDGKANPAALWDFYSNGCSIRLLNPQTYNKKVHLLISTLQEYFGSMVGVNVYLTPPGSQGFAPHYDDIEAFVIQLEGRKHWKLYHPKKNEVLARFSSDNFKHADIGKPFMEVTLEAGSLLYFPRGVIHEGRTDEESHSLHLTVSMYQKNAYVDILEKMFPKALEEASKDDIEFRQGLPLHFLRNEGLKGVIEKTVSKLFDKVKNYMDVNVGFEQLGRRLVYDSMPPVLSHDEVAFSSQQDGDMLDNGIVFNKVEFDISVKVRLTRFHCVQLVTEDDKSKLYYSTENSNVYHGEDEQWLELDKEFVPAFVMLKKSYPSFIEVKNLPIEDEELKIQFVYDLWEKGIVVTEKPLSGYSK